MATPRLNVQTGLIVCAVLYGGYKLLDKPAAYQIENSKHLAPPSRERRAIEHKAYLEKTREYSEARAKGLATPEAARPAPPTPRFIPTVAAPVAPPGPPVAQTLHFDPAPAGPEYNRVTAPAAPATRNTYAGRDTTTARDTAAAPRPDAPAKADEDAPARPLSLKERLEQKAFTSKSKSKE